MYVQSYLHNACRFFFPSRKIKFFLLVLFIFSCLPDDIERRTDERTNVHEQKTEKWVFERRLIVCIKDRRKKPRARERERERVRINAEKR